MRQDLRISQDENGFFDLDITGRDLTAVAGMEAAINVSMFTDARASSAQVPDPSRRRGWVGDVLTADIGRSLGGLLWIYEQSRMTANIQNAIADDAERSLQWMIDDGVARAVNSVVSTFNNRSVTINIEITTPQDEVNTYEIIWRRTRASGLSNV